MAWARYELLSTDPSGARRGRLHLPHGTVETPVFMPVGTRAAVRAIDTDDLVDTLEPEIILGNTYHLMLRPGHERIERLGGLHKFMAWPKCILTDSGGYQVFSLAESREITEEGATFKSHHDGSSHLLTPEKAVSIQESLGSDIMMAFDECPPLDAGDDYLEDSQDRTTRWLDRCIAAWNPETSPGNLFGIIQGGHDERLRTAHAQAVTERDLPGYAIGGLSVGEDPELMWEFAAFTAKLMPQDKPRYLMGVGRPEDLLSCVEGGVDMFDCVLPTRTARHAHLFTSRGRLNLRNARFADDPRPLDPECKCPCCRTYSRAYLRHCYMARELTAMRLGTLHNLWFYLRMMERVRKAIEEGTFAALKAELLEGFARGAED